MSDYLSKITFVGWGGIKGQHQYHLFVPEKCLGQYKAIGFAFKKQFRSSGATFTSRKGRGNNRILELMIPAKKLDVALDLAVHSFLNQYHPNRKSGGAIFRMNSGPCQAVVVYEQPSKVLTEGQKEGLKNHFQETLALIPSSSLTCFLSVDVNTVSFEATATVMDITQMGLGHAERRGTDAFLAARTAFDDIIPLVRRISEDFPAVYKKARKGGT